VSASRQDRDEMLDRLHADRSRAEQDRRYNEATSELDVAIRYLNRAKKCIVDGEPNLADHWRCAAGILLENIGPELLIIDPDVIL